MDDTSRTALLATIRAHCAKPPQAVLFDEAGDALMDVSSGKVQKLAAADLMTLDERVNPETKNPYLVLVYGDGRRIALAEMGIAFAPDFQNTGPLPDLSPVVCFRDYATLLTRLKHELYGHPDQPPTRATVQLLMMCIAIIDGARAQGFDVGREEKELEWHLKELERLAPPSAAS